MNLETWPFAPAQIRILAVISAAPPKKTSLTKFHLQLKCGSLCHSSRVSSNYIHLNCPSANQSTMHGEVENCTSCFDISAKYFLTHNLICKITPYPSKQSPSC